MCWNPTNRKILLCIQTALCALKPAQHRVYLSTWDMQTKAMWKQAHMIWHLYFGLNQRQGNTSLTGSRARSLRVTCFAFPPKEQTHTTDRWIGLWKLCQRRTALMAMIHSRHWQICFPPSCTRISNKPSNKHIPLLLQLACSLELTRPVVTAGCNWTNAQWTDNITVPTKSNQSF